MFGSFFLPELVCSVLLFTSEWFWAFFMSSSVKPENFPDIFLWILDNLKIILTNMWKCHEFDVNIDNAHVRVWDLK